MNENYNRKDAEFYRLAVKIAHAAFVSSRQNMLKTLKLSNKSTEEAFKAVIDELSGYLETTDSFVPEEQLKDYHLIYEAHGAEEAVYMCLCAHYQNYFDVPMKGSFLETVDQVRFHTDVMLGKDKLVFDMSAVPGLLHALHESRPDEGDLPIGVDLDQYDNIRIYKAMLKLSCSTTLASTDVAHWPFENGQALMATISPLYSTPERQKGISREALEAQIGSLDLLQKLSNQSQSFFNDFVDYFYEMSCYGVALDFGKMEKHTWFHNLDTDAATIRFIDTSKATKKFIYIERHSHFFEVALCLFAPEQHMMRYYYLPEDSYRMSDIQPHQMMDMGFRHAMAELKNVDGSYITNEQLQNHNISALYDCFMGKMIVAMERHNLQEIEISDYFKDEVVQMQTCIGKKRSHWVKPFLKFSSLLERDFDTKEPERDAAIDAIKSVHFSMDTERVNLSFAKLIEARKALLTRER